MKESNFIKKNLDSWNEYERIITLKENKPNKLSKLFIKITDDLSYAYTYYNNRSVRLYLNSFAKLLYNRVNRSERFKFSSISGFFTVSVPLSIYQARREFMVAFTVFAVAMLIGILSSKYDTEFAQLILGNDYVEMTNANIEKNDPMAVYKSQAPFDMFFAITLNNCLVAMRTFVFGFFMAIGTILIMLYNGIMVGAFQYYFVEQGLFKESFLTIWQHGVFEISSIIMAGAAGLVLGKGLVFPGNFTRFQSLRISARRGLKLLLGIIPILVVAGFIEGFYTRFTDAPDFLRILTILVSLFFIIGYFILLPRYRSRQYESDIGLENRIEVPGSFNIRFEKIYTGPELFMLSFQLFKQWFWYVTKWVLIIALIFPLALYFLQNSELAESYTGSIVFRPMETIQQNFIAGLLLAISFTIVSIILFRIPFSNQHTSAAAGYKTPVVQFLVIIALAHLCLFIPSYFFAMLLFVLILLLSILIMNTMRMEGKSIFTATIRSLKYISGSFGKIMYLSFIYLTLGVLFYFIFIKLVGTFNNELVQMNFYGSDETGKLVIYYINAYYFSAIMLFSFGVIFFGMHVLYHSLYETYHAADLIARINQIGKTKRVRGLIRE